MSSSARAAKDVDVAPTRPRLYHNFKTNFNDHFETSAAALQHVLPVVAELRHLTRPSTPELFSLYDPYYCSGTVATHWAALGIERFLHANRDFYADIAAGTVPGPYDMIVTNPPFSEDHIQRLMNFLVSQDIPWAFLAPDYIAGKEWYQSFVKKHFTPATHTAKGNVGAPKRRPVAPAAVFSLPPFLQVHQQAEQQQQATSSCDPAIAAEGRAGAEGANAATNAATAPDTKMAAPVVLGPEPFYIIPTERYDFQHPTGAGKEHSHFKSMWYVWLGRRTAEVVRGTTVALLKAGSQSSVTVPQYRQTVPAVVHGLEALIEGKYVQATEQRQNPKQRRTRQQQNRHGSSQPNSGKRTSKFSNPRR